MNVNNPHRFQSRKLFWSVILVLAGIVFVITWIFASGNSSKVMIVMGMSQPDIEFDALRAYQDIEYQVALGPRIPGSEAHQKIQDWMLQELESNRWETEVQNTAFEGQPVSNIIGKYGQGKPWIVLGAHYDTRLYADLDPDPSKILEPVPGANDGGSGVAVLLELARQLPAHFQGADGSKPEIQGTIWLVFFDAEDNGRIEGWDWILGSRAFVAELQSYPDAAVIVDMVGDKNLKIYQEENSDDLLTREIWDSAESIGYADYFLPYEKYAILDDHVPFLEAGIPAADIIDFEYAYWHTTGDTPDKVSAESLEIVGETLLAWLLDQF